MGIHEIYGKTFIFNKIKRTYYNIRNGKFLSELEKKNRDASSGVENNKNWLCCINTKCTFDDIQRCP